MRMTLKLSSLFLSIVVAATAATVFAHDDHGDHGDEGGHHFVPKPNPIPTHPSEVYSGNTAIDLKHGVPFTNGTYGAANPDYEKWAQSSTWAVSLAERQYSYDQKDRFIKTLDERIQHFEHAIWNYGRVTDISKEEGKAHAAKATADLTPRVDRARDAWKKAKSAGKGDWEQLQDEAKRTFLELQSAYYSMHHNVR